MGLGGHLADPGSILKESQKVHIQILSIVASSISFTACLVTLYWFLSMRRNFRRTLIMLLLIADLLKSSWFMIFPAVSLSHGGISTGANFCLAGGFFIQCALEACDFAILSMSIHMSMQILSPKSGGQDGMYRWRYFIYAGYLCVPSLMAGLAFVNGKNSYLSQGAFCTLPIRPFWYRLALSWIPRYLVWIYVVYVVIRIYRRVGSGFQVFAKQADGSSQEGSSQSVRDRRGSRIPLPPRDADIGLCDPSTSTDPAPNRRGSTVHWQQSSEPDNGMLGPSWQSSRRGSYRTDDIKDFEVADSPMESKPSGAQYPMPNDMMSSLSPVNETPAMEPKPPKPLLVGASDPTGAKKRRMVLRQVRLLFIYPCVYMIFMIFPFIAHCFNYSDYYAQHPIYIIQALGTFCWSFMGFADCLIFSWREKPWTHIPGSDGSFWGSFCFWRFNKDVGERSITPSSSSGEPSRSKIRSPRSVLRNSKKVQPHRRVFSGGSDQAALAAERAAERLEMERMAARPAMAQRLSSNAGKEWFEVEDLADDEREDAKS